MRALPLLICVVASTARADCPMQVQELPPASLVDTTVVDLGLARKSVANGVATGVSAGVGAEANNTSLDVIGNVAGEVDARHGGWQGCVSGDARLATDPSLRVTANGRIPLVTSSLILSVAIDREIELGLAARPEYLRAPLDSSTFESSFALLDLQLAEPSSQLRFEAMPVAFAATTISQRGEAGERTRNDLAIELAMLRLIATDETASGTFDVGRLHVDQLASGAIDAFAVDALALDYAGTGRIHVAASGGLVSNGTIARGSYAVAFGHAWRRTWFETQVARSSFLAADDSLALEDRATSSVAIDLGPRKATLTAFAARTRPFAGGPVVSTGGGKLAISQALDHHLVATVDTEVARGYYGAADLGRPELATSARVLAHLDWQRKHPAK